MYFLAEYLDRRPTIRPNPCGNIKATWKLSAANYFSKNRLSTFSSKRGSTLPLLFVALLAILGWPNASKAISDPNTDLLVRYAELANLPAWSALLHADEFEFHIKDPHFLLSLPNASLAKELKSTIEAFSLPVVTNKTHPICRFPARFLWLSSQLGWQRRDFPHVDCHEFTQYLQKAPADGIKLVFASENVLLASSMMGHAFLKLEGHDENGKLLEHSASYFTLLDTLNLPKLAYKIFVSGMPGLFALNPYQAQKTRYLIDEKRNIWEYALNITEAEKQLIHAHIWELKGVQSQYFFTSYNCATFTYYLLALAKPAMMVEKSKWISPLDVVKESFRVGLISQSELFPSKRWEIKMLNDQMTQDLSKQVRLSVLERKPMEFSKSYTSEQRQFALKLYQSFVAYLGENGELNTVDASTLQSNIALMNDGPNETLPIDVSAYKSPTKTPSDSQIAIATGKAQSQSFLEFRYLTASHRVEDDNRQYFGENGLKLAEITLRMTPTDRAPKVHELLLYSMTSINPWDSFTGGISTKFQFGFERHFDRQLNDHLSFSVNAGVGESVSLHHDLLAFAFVSGGYGYGDSRNYLFYEPEIGLIVNEILNMKTVLRYRQPYNHIDSASRYNAIDLSQSLFISNKHALFLTGKQQWTTHKTLNDVALSYVRYF